MTDRNLTRELMGLLAENSRNGVASCPITTEIMETVPDAVISPSEFPVWSKMKELAGMGSPPTVMALRRALPNVPNEYWVSLKSEESSIRDLRDAVLDEAQYRAYVQAYRDMGVMLRERKAFSEINEMLGNVMDEAVAGAPEPTALNSFSYMDYINALMAGNIPYIRTPWEQINEMLGGGLHMGGDKAMSAILAYSSVGKTRVAQQINHQAGMDGHVVDVFAGESNALAYKLALGQMIGRVPKVAMNPDRMGKDTIKILERVESLIDGMNTFVYDKAFNLNRIRGLMIKRAREIKERKTRGDLKPDACYLVIIDNIDHAISGGGDQEWKELEQAAKGLYNTAQRLNCHVLILAQSKIAGFRQGYPPGLTDFARANLIASHCSNIISLYRPVEYEQVHAPPDDTRSIPKISVVKTRGNGTGTYECTSDPSIGLWV
jgi:hypothetical protein